MNKLIVCLLYIISFTLFQLSVDSNHIQSWIGYLLSFIVLALAYAKMNREFSKPSYTWKCKSFHRF